jgi:phospholipase/carboxylesterase
MSGYLNLDMAIEGFEKNDISGLKIFASHGTVDQVIPVEWARKTPQLLENFGIDVVYKEYPIGHGVSPQNFFDFRKWLAENK